MGLLVNGMDLEDTLVDGEPIKMTGMDSVIIMKKTLTPYKEKEVSLLEIGTNYGCSAIMWHDFLPKSKNASP